MIALAVMVGALVALALAGVRAIGGPTLQDRALATYSIVEKIVLMCAAATVLGAPAAWIEAAFALLLSGYVVNVAILKVFRFGNLQAPLSQSNRGR